MFSIKKIFFVFVGCVFAVFLYRTFLSGSYEIVNIPPQNVEIIAFGDSLVYGVGSEQEGGFVPVLSELIGVPILNAGISGDTTVHGLRRLDKDVLDYNPGVVLVLLGGNNYLQKIPEDETFDDLEEIVNRIQEKNAVVVLIGVQGGILSDHYGPLYEKLARETGSVYVENILDGLLGNSKYMYDSIHPNDAGYKIIAEKIALEIAFLFE